MKFLQAIFFILLFALPAKQGLAQATFPELLSQTGLYLDIATYEIAPHNWPFSPQYPLWSNGASKKRWIYLPNVATPINNHNQDKWDFPVGTKFWKEFSFQRRDGSYKRVETRMLVKIEKNQWQQVSYEWNEEQSEATLVGAQGRYQAFQINQNTYHSIPSRRDCLTCHANNQTILGFSGLQLSNQRDPLAIHGEALTQEMLTVGKLKQLDLFTAPVSADIVIENNPQNPLQKPLMGYFVANCAHCHRPDGYAGFTQLHLNFEIGRSLREQPFMKTALNIRSRSRFSGSHRLRPHSLENSQIYNRIQSGSMPMLANELIDQEVVEILKAYILDFQK